MNYQRQRFSPLSKRNSQLKDRRVLEESRRQVQNLQQQNACLAKICQKLSRKSRQLGASRRVSQSERQRAQKECQWVQEEVLRKARQLQISTRKYHQIVSAFQEQLNEYRPQQQVLENALSQLKATNLQLAHKLAGLKQACEASRAEVERCAQRESGVMQELSELEQQERQAAEYQRQFQRLAQQIRSANQAIQEAKQEFKSRLD